MTSRKNPQLYAADFFVRNLILTHCTITVKFVVPEKLGELAVTVTVPVVGGVV